MQKKSVTKFDFSETAMPMVVLYDKPDDFPNNAVARLFDGLKGPTKQYVLYDSVDAARKDIRQLMMILMPKHPEDPKCIVETYI